MHNPKLPNIWMVLLPTVTSSKGCSNSHTCAGGRIKVLWFLLLNICIFNQYKNSGFCVFYLMDFLRCARCICVWWSVAFGDDLLPMAEFQYNNHVHSSTRQTPFMLDTGWHPHMGFEPHQNPSHMESVIEFKEWMEESLSKVKSALVKL